MNCGKLFSSWSRAISSFSKSISFSRILERIVHDVEGKRFVMALPSADAYVEYNKTNGNLNLFNIYVPKRYRAIGIGEDLAREVLEFCVKNDIKVFLSCPYLVTFYKLHPDPQFKKVVRGVAVKSSKKAESQPSE